jgi:hypothetical protein
MEFNDSNISIDLDSLSNDKESFLNRFKGKYHGDVEELWEKIKPLLEGNGTEKLITSEPEHKKDNVVVNTKKRTKRQRSSKTDS